jgi:hypothetical protein
MDEAWGRWVYGRHRLSRGLIESDRRTRIGTRRPSFPRKALFSSQSLNCYVHRPGNDYSPKL